MAVSHKDWELPNSRIRLIEVDIESGLDFRIYDRHLDRLNFAVKKLQTKMQNIDYFLVKVFFMAVPESLIRKM